MANSMRAQKIHSTAPVGASRDRANESVPQEADRVAESGYEEQGEEEGGY